MCGILGYYCKPHKNRQDLVNKVLNSSKIIRHRGPDWNGIFVSPRLNVALAHERLSIVDVNTGNQPLYSPDTSIVLVCNGEIYNHIKIREKYSYNYQTNSDCEVIIPLYIKYGLECVNHLDGIFSFILYDIINQVLVVSRDRIGVNPLYYGVSKSGDGWWFSSEFKAIAKECHYKMDINDFPPGHIWSSVNGVSLNRAGLLSTPFNDNLKQYYNPDWYSGNVASLLYKDLTEGETCKMIRESLINSVRKRLMCDVPFGVLLSGGLDSSLIASITSRYSKSILNNVWGSKLHTFSIGLKGSPDLKYAREVAKFLDTYHHECNFTIEDGLNAIRDVIFHTETYDITTIRASTPMYLMSRIIKAHGIKMVLSGEGSDELFGGYLYFHQAPNSREFHRECVKKVRDIHKFDCLRANKSTMAWGVEARVPFLDTSFVDSVMNINPAYKFCAKDLKTGRNRIEKSILRKAFQAGNWLPDSVLWRQKEQFGDGVGYSWIDSVREHAGGLVSDLELDNASDKYPYNTPETKEAYYYRKIFSEIYPNREKSVKEWVPQIGWGNVGKDPSGRVQIAHDEDYNMAKSTHINVQVEYSKSLSAHASMPVPEIEATITPKLEKDENIKSITIDKKTKQTKKTKSDISISKSKEKEPSNDLKTQERCLQLIV